MATIPSLKAQAPTLDQSNFIFFALFIAFIVYITMRGELPKYLGFFVFNPSAGSNAVSNTLSSAPLMGPTTVGSTISNPNIVTGGSNTGTVVGNVGGLPIGITPGSPADSVYKWFGGTATTPQTGH